MSAAAMPNQTTDGPIRHAIRASLITAHRGQDAVIVDELKVSLGSSRMDVAVINGRIEGFEIKSDRDSLSRLGKQAQHFGSIAERMTLVVGERHLAKAVPMVPDWWTVVVATAREDGTVSLARVRRGRLNQSLDKRSLVEMLERDEVVALLSSKNLDKGFRSANFAVLADLAVARMSSSAISAFVKTTIKLRARFAYEFADLAFGRSAIICGEPSEKCAG